MNGNTLKRLGVAALAVVTMMAACGSSGNSAGTGSGADDAAGANGSGDGAGAPQVAQAGGSPSSSTSTSTEEQLRSFENAFANVAEELLPVVVEVNVVNMVEVPQSPFEFFFSPRGRDQEQREVPRRGLGSGVIVRQDGNEVYVITNNHVVQDADRLNVGLSDGRQYEAEMIGGDSRLDLALLRFTSSEDVPVANFADSNDLRVGDWVVAVGNPFGFESTVTSGIVSALGRTSSMAQAQQQGANMPTLTDFIQTDAAINPGNSGGALANLDGDIVGINTWIASQSGGSVGIGFAIPANVAQKAVNDFIQEGEIIYGWLGVSIAEANPSLFANVRSDLELGERTGALILNVYEGSPAGEQGILPGDFVTQVNGEQIDNASQLTRVIGNLRPDETISLEVIRNGESERLELTISQRQPESELEELSDRLWPGMVVSNLNDSIRQQLDVSTRVDGVVTMQVAGESPAEQANVRQGDVIRSIDGETVESMSEFYRLLNESGDDARLGIWRQGATTEVTLNK
jgi:serine protease Do